MNKAIPYVFFAAALVAIELVYFRIARYYKILDHPNDRSLHQRPTIRGGGIIFPLTALLFFAFTSRPEGLFIFALILVSSIGFIDDIKSLGSAIRFVVQAVAFAIIFFIVDLSEIPYWLVAVMFIVAVGAINTFNFMDGINGITGAYSLVTLGSLLFVNLYIVHFTNSDFIEAIVLSVLVFGFFNFRKKAVCFAGDVGSLSIGFIILFLLIELISVSGNYCVVIVLSVYGVDSILTIIHRLLRKENIFKPHKLHLFQELVNQHRIPHLMMSFIYAAVQTVINAIVIMSFQETVLFQTIVALTILFLLGVSYLVIKSRFLPATQPN